jgi:hypothetical protein
MKGFWSTDIVAKTGHFGNNLFPKSSVSGTISACPKLLLVSGAVSVERK